MDGGLITYEALYDVLRNEKSNVEIQQLEKDFFDKVVRYLREKKDILESQRLKDSVFASDSVKKTKKQVENIQRILKEIYERRESKITQLAIACSRTKTRYENRSVFLHEEAQLFDAILAKLNEFRQGIIENLIMGNEVKLENGPKSIKTPEQPSNDNTKVKFAEGVPEFMGADLKQYGPFKKEEVKELPKKVADFLIKNKRAEEIK